MRGVCMYMMPNIYSYLSVNWLSAPGASGCHMIYKI